MHRTRVKQEESSSGEDSEVDSDEFEDDTDEEEWLPSGQHRRRPQRAAGSSSSSEESDESEEPPKLVATKKDAMRTVYSGPFPACDVCGMKSFGIRAAYESHLAAHGLTGGFVCSLCGLQRRDHFTRERHERQVHFFWRPKEDRQRKEAIRIKKELRAAFWQVGRNVDEVQRAALLSKTNTDVFTPVVYDRKRRQSKAATGGRPAKRPAFAPVIRPVPEVITLDDSEDEDADRPGSSGFQPPGRDSLPPVQHLPSPVPKLPPPIVAPARPLVRVAPIEPPAEPPVELREESRVIRVLEALQKCPQFLFYDHKALGMKFGKLPVGKWATAADCSLLLLRSATAEWPTSSRMPAHTVHFQLADRNGHFLVFKKEGVDGPVLDRLLFPGAQRTSFRRLMEEIARSDLRSSLIVADEMDSAAVCDLQSDRFVVV